MDTESDRNQKCIGQGLAHGLTGSIGGTVCCAMIGPSGINVRFGGHGRLSTFTAGFMPLVLFAGLGDWVSRIPMPARVAITIMVAIGTLSWTSVLTL